ncbi:hypothetical protein LP419_03200 [Massilia sp. H-1]|nr:hypothetical protein LP419_03200 [Massilia sp. H-1]
MIGEADQAGAIREQVEHSLVALRGLSTKTAARPPGWGRSIGVSLPNKLMLSVLGVISLTKQNFRCMPPPVIAVKAGLRYNSEV